MPYASESFVGSAGVQTYVFGAGTGSLTGGLKFLSADHLTVEVDNVVVAFTVPAGQASFTIVSPPILGGETILVTRTTPATEAGRVVNFEDLSYLRQVDLDRSSRQLLYLAQESLDIVAGVERLELGLDGHWDAENRRIESMAPGVASTDGVVKSQLDAVSVAAGNLPVVSSADNDKSLFVVAGAWAIRTPAQARVHLGLGTAAVLNAGTGASQVVQLDGSARYPANDGRNIDLTNNAVTTALNLRYRSTVAQLRKTAEQTPVNDATATWSESAGSILDIGTLTSLDNSGDVSLASNIVTLAAGTWEIQYTLRAYNQNAGAGNDQDIRVKLTDEVNSGAQVVYDNVYDRIDIESAGSGSKAFWTLGNTLLVKLPAGGKVALRAANEDGTDIRIPDVMLTFRKVSTSTS